MSMPKPVCPTGRPPLPSARRGPDGGEAARRVAQAGRATKARLAPLAVTHRYNRTHCLWLEQFQIDAPMSVNGSDDVLVLEFPGLGKCFYGWGCWVRTRQGRATPGRRAGSY